MIAAPAGGRNGRQVRLLILGTLIGLGAMIGGAEEYLRSYPPADILEFLGKASPATGPYRADTDYGRSFRDWEALITDTADTLEPHLPLDADSKPTWAFFGNSFVQGQGMLGDTVSRAAGDHHIFYLKRLMPLELRLAQMQMLMAHGLRAQRVVVVLLPVDGWCLVKFPIRRIEVTPRGATTYTIDLPPWPLDSLVRTSRVALTAWRRMELHLPQARIEQSQVLQGLPRAAGEDLSRLLAAASRDAGSHGATLTVLLIPAREQTARGAPLGFQRDVALILENLGIDHLDVSELLRLQTDREGLYIPDGHLSLRGNQIVAKALLDHFGYEPAGPPKEAKVPRQP